MTGQSDGATDLWYSCECRRTHRRTFSQNHSTAR